MERFLIDYTGPSAKKRKTAEERLKQQRDLKKKSGPVKCSQAVGGPVDFLEYLWITNLTGPYVLWVGKCKGNPCSFLVNFIKVTLTGFMIFDV